METLFRKVEVKSEKDYPSESELKENFKHRPDKTIGHEEYNRIQDHFMAGAKWAIDRIKSLNSSRKESEPMTFEEFKKKYYTDLHQYGCTEQRIFFEGYLLNFKQK